MDVRNQFVSWFITYSRTYCTTYLLAAMIQLLSTMDIPVHVMQCLASRMFSGCQCTESIYPLPGYGEREGRVPDALVGSIIQVGPQKTR